MAHGDRSIRSVGTNILIFVGFQKIKTGTDGTVSKVLFPGRHCRPVDQILGHTLP